jgi:hypothetical protein
MAAAQKEANPARSEVIYDLDAAAFCSDDFRMFQFKVGPAGRAAAPRLSRPRSARAGRNPPSDARLIAAADARRARAGVAPATAPAPRRCMLALPARR